MERVGEQTAAREGVEERQMPDQRVTGRSR